MSITNLLSENYFVSFTVIIFCLYVISTLVEKFTYKKSDLPEAVIKEQAINLLINNQRIKAIKHLRRNLNMSLKDSVEFVNNYAKKDYNKLSDQELRVKVLELTSKGKKIEAIKVVRKNTGMDLKNSKEFVESIVN